MPLAFLSWTPADLINHVWQSSVVALALLLLAALCLRLPARTRLTLGWMALAKFVLPFGFFAGFVTLLGGDPERWLVSRVFTAPIEMPAKFTATPAANLAFPLGSEALLPASVPAPASASEPAPTGSLRSRLLLDPSLPALAAALWLAGFAALYGGWLIAGFRLRRHVLEGATPVSPGLEQHLAEAAAKAGMNALPRRLEVRAEHSPGLLGVFAPILLIPRGLEEKLTPAELQSVLLHELTHLQRRDPFWLAVHVTAVSALWFNPISWLLSRWIRLETEKACDERVLGLTGRPDIYAQGILKVVRHALGLPEPRLLSVITPPIVSRMKNILGHGQRPHRRWQTSFALGTGALVLALAGHAGTLAIAASVSTPVAASTGAASRESQAPTVTGAPFTQRDDQVGNYRFTPAGETTGPASLLAQTITPPAAPLPPPTSSLPVTQVTSTTPVAQKTTAQRDTLSVDFPEEEIRAILRSVADLFQINIIIPETLQGKTSIKLRDANWRQIFTVVLDPVGYTFQEEGNIVRILRRVPLVQAPLEPGIEKIHSLQEVDTVPVVVAQERPAYPLGPKIGGSDGSAVIGFVVDANGDVQEARAISSSDPLFAEAALTAVRKWKFVPGRIDNRRVATMMEVPLWFTPTDNQSSATVARPGFLALSAGVPPTLQTVYELKDLDLPPRAALQVGAVYPLEMKTKGIEGWVEVAFIVDSNGLVQNVRALSSSQREFEVAALTAVQKWKFQPGRKGGTEVAVNMAVQIKFSLAGQRPAKTSATPPATPVFAAAATPAPLDTPKVELVDTPPPQPTPLDGPRAYALEELDVKPTPTLQIGAVYPPSLKRSGVEGWVNVAFVVDEKGLLRNVHARDSSDDRFEFAAIEAVKKWKFRPGRIANKPVATQLNVQIKFSLTGSSK